MKRLVVEIAGIGQATSIVLTKHGFKTVDDIANASIESLSVVPGFADVRSFQTIKKANDLLKVKGDLPLEKVSKPAKTKKEIGSKKPKKDKKTAKKSKNKDKKAGKNKVKLVAKELAKKVAKLKNKKAAKNKAKKAGSKADAKKKKSKKSKKKQMVTTKV